MSKPWLEEWEPGDGDMTCVYSPTRNVSLLMERDDARLIAAAPALVRALLAVELTVVRLGDIGPVSACRWSAHAEAIHKPGCSVDAALTAAGLPDQASRDEAREELAERKP
jgi:hypothetical protein